MSRSNLARDWFGTVPGSLQDGTAAPERKGQTMTWADGIIAAFDIETTGLDPELDEIVQAAIVIVDDAGQLLPQSWSTIVNPGRPISPESTAVHGITNERAVRDGMPADEATSEILVRLAAAAEQGTPVVIYNAPFDLGFMQVRAERRHATLPALSVIDPLVCDRALDRYRSGSRTLASVAAQYGCAAEHLHDAERDAAVSVAVARAMARRYPQMAQSTLAELGRQQSAWHAAWVDNFAAYQRQNGRDTSGIESGWPVPRRLHSTPSVAVPATAGALSQRAATRPWWRFW
ncbi:MAG: exonuclease domain-containing protein [Chloroflexi bacterium]|nr:exonuclease domain-containing protein [Chloroflexota bacterium]